MACVPSKHCNFTGLLTGTQADLPGLKRTYRRPCGAGLAIVAPSTLRARRKQPPSEARTRPVPPCLSPTPMVPQGWARGWQVIQGGWENREGSGLVLSLTKPG